MLTDSPYIDHLICIAGLAMATVFSGSPTNNKLHRQLTVCFLQVQVDDINSLTP